MATVTGGKVAIVNNPSDSSSACTVTAPNGNCERYVGAVLMVGVMQPGASLQRRP
jgi:hypothetical protein